MEGFWGILKCEMYHLNHFETYEELATAIEQFVHYYNYQRRQSAQVELFAAGYLPQLAGSCINENQDSISGILVKRFLFFHLST